MDIGPYGIWTFNLDLVPSSQAIEHVAELEELGFGAVWIPEAVGREPFTSAAILLRGGETHRGRHGDRDDLLARSR